jgi:mitogen-activated protein kinase kinase kinase kinase 2
MHCELGDPEVIFTLLEKIGQGSYGEVFKARDNRDQQTVALKLIPADEDNQHVEREITILKECKHENIVLFKGAFLKDEDLWVRKLGIMTRTQ